MLTVWLATLLIAGLDKDPAFAEGQRLYQALEYEQAIFRFEEVAVRRDLDDADRATALMWLGLSYAGTGDFDGAKRNLGDALRADPTVELPANVSPRVVELFKELQAEVKKSPPDKPKTGTPKKPPPTSAPSPLFLASAAGAAVGAVAIVGGIVFSVQAARDFSRANDPTLFQDDAKDALDAANRGLIGAFVLLPLGTALVAGGVAGMVWGPSLEDGAH